MKYLKFLSVFMLLSLMFNCSVNNITKAKDALQLHNKWELTTLDGEDIQSNNPLYIQLTSDNKVSGFIGCNRLNGSYAIEDHSQIQFQNLSTTRVLCSDESMKLEYNLLDALENTDNFTIDDNKLMLNIGNRAPLAIFTKMSDSPIVNKYWKLKTLDGKEVKMNKNQEKEQFFILKSDGSFNGFGGCNNFNGQYKLKDDNTIKFLPNLAMSLASCPDSNYNEQEYVRIFKDTIDFDMDEDKLKLRSNNHSATFEAVYF